jgi:hypothetical protein
MTEYKEIIVALIAVFGAVLAYLLQKNKELNQNCGAKTRGIRHFPEGLHRDSGGCHA